MLFQERFCLMVANFTFYRFSRNKPVWVRVGLSHTGCHNHHHHPEQSRNTQTRQGFRPVVVTCSHLVYNKGLQSVKYIPQWNPFPLYSLHLPSILSDSRREEKRLKKNTIQMGNTALLLSVSLSWEPAWNCLVLFYHMYCFSYHCTS